MTKEDLQVGKTYLANVNVFVPDDVLGRWHREITPCKLLQIQKLSSGREVYHVEILKTGRKCILYSVAKFRGEVVVDKA